MINLNTTNTIKKKKLDLEGVLDQVKEKLQDVVTKVKNLEVVLQLKVLRVVKCLCTEDFQKEVLIQLKVSI